MTAFVLGYLFPLLFLAAILRPGNVSQDNDERKQE